MVCAPARKLAGWILPDAMRLMLFLLAAATVSTCGPPSPDREASPQTTIDLAEAFAAGALTPVARSAVLLDEDDRRGVALDSVPATGLVWIDDVTFETGRISFVVRGRDVQGASFVGLAFGGVNDSTYEAVYLRPFNFNADDSTRHAHGIQYISHPEHPWYVLREQYPGDFEHAVTPDPPADAWQTVRLDVTPDSVVAWVGEGDEADLSVRRLAPSRGNRVALWIGFGSPGDFSLVTVIPATASGQPAT